MALAAIGSCSFSLRDFLPTFGRIGLPFCNATRCLMLSNNPDVDGGGARARDRDGSIVGIGAFTPRTTITGPLIKDRLAFTQSLEYRFVRTPVESLPPLQRYTKLESFDSFSQFDLKISERQSATLSLAVFPQKFDYLGLNTFTPQPSTTDLHQRGYQISAQHSFVRKSGALLSSRFAYEEFDADWGGYVHPGEPRPSRFARGVGIVAHFEGKHRLQQRAHRDLSGHSRWTEDVRPERQQL